MTNAQSPPCTNTPSLHAQSPRGETPQLPMAEAPARRPSGEKRRSGPLPPPLPGIFEIRENYIKKAVKDAMRSPAAKSTVEASGPEEDFLGGESSSQLLSSQQSVSKGAKSPRRASKFDSWMNTHAKKDQEKEVKALEEKETKQKEDVLKFESAVPFMANRQNMVQNLVQMKKVFSSFDRDGSGTIEQKEFPDLLSKFTRIAANKMKQSEIWQCWDKIDKDGNQVICFEEFQNWYCATFGIRQFPEDSELFFAREANESEDGLKAVSDKLGLHILDVEKVWRQFAKLDADNSGALSKEEFAILITSQMTDGGDVEVPQKIIDTFWRDVDSAKAGLVRFATFAEWYFRFFHGSDLSPMEQFYETKAQGWRSRSAQPK